MIRDSAYYLDRLEREHPAIFAGYKAGRYRSAREACIAGGLQSGRTRLSELKNAWGKATLPEQRDFLAWIRATTASAPPPVKGRAVAIDRRLEPWAKVRISEIVSRRGLRMGELMTEMGFAPLNASVGGALARSFRLAPDVIAALEKWLDANRAV